MKLAFTGDTVFTGLFEGQETNTELLSDEVKAFFDRSDVCVCDVEGPICSQNKITDRVAIKSGPEMHRFLSAIRANVLFLGNNHILDYGESGLYETLDIAARNGFRAIGAGRTIKEASEPLLFDGICGLLALRYQNKHARATETECGCLIWDEEKLIREKIAEIKSKCRWCILVIHGGDEFCPMPLPEIRKRYLKFLGWGADIIVGHHPHVVQNYELIGDKIIFYSLGNFVFDDRYMRVFAEAREGVVLRLDVDENGFTWEYLPIVIDGDQKRIYAGTDSPAFFCIKNETEYSDKLPDLARTFLRNERRNLAYQAKRTDISLSAKCRIVMSHTKRYRKEKKRLRKYL